MSKGTLEEKKGGKVVELSVDPVFCGMGKWGAVFFRPLGSLFLPLG